MKRGEDAAGAVSSFPLIDAGLGGSGLVSKRALKHVLGEIRTRPGFRLPCLEERESFWRFQREKDSCLRSWRRKVSFRTA